MQSTDSRWPTPLAYVPQVRDVFDPLSALPFASELEEQRASTLSGGERKMLAICRVYMTWPKALLLDEPTASLAPKIADSLLAEHMAKLATLGVVIILVEQRAVQALAIASNAYVMVDGKVAASGTPADLGDRGEVARHFPARLRAPARLSRNAHSITVIDKQQVLLDTPGLGGRNPGCVPGSSFAGFHR